MNIKNFLVMLLAIVLAVVYVYFSAENKPEKGIMLSPKEYMLLIEKDKPPPDRKP